MSYFDWDYLGLGCQYPVSNVGALVLGPKPEVDCDEPAVAIARWYETDDPGEEPATMLLCEKHLKHVLKTEKEQREAEEGASAPSRKEELGENTG